MPYTLIKGAFHIHYPENPRSGPEPDGDTLKFRPVNRGLIEALPQPGWGPRFTSSGISTIRFEGIDALETHYDVGDTEFHQEMALALAARDALLAEAGFGDVTFFQDKPFKVEDVENHPIPGYILSNGLDTFGRAVAFAFAGTSAVEDGSRVHVDAQMLNDSLNVQLLEAGHAYPAFYLSLPEELRAHLRSISIDARADGVGLWAKATATITEAASIPSADELQKLVIWPKLFRRLAAFFQSGNTSLSALDVWLRADPRDRDDRVLLPNLELGNMHDLIRVEDDRLLLVHPPEDVVIVPDDYVLPEAQPTQPTRTHVGVGHVRIVGALINAVELPEHDHESVTVLNTTAASISLVGWHIADRNGRLPLSGHLGDGDTLRILLSAAVRLSNIRDTITLLDPHDVIVDQVSYEPRNVPPEGETLVF